MENSGTFKNIIIAILIAVAGYFSYTAYNAEDQLSSQTAAVMSELEAKVAAQSKDLEDLKMLLEKSVKPAKVKEAPKATKKK